MKSESDIQSSAVTVGRIVIVSPLLILTTLFGTCSAQNGDTVLDASFFLPVIIFVVIACVMCVLFWVCVCGIVCFTKSRTSAVTRIPHNVRERSTQQVIYPHAGGGSQPYPGQSNYPQSYPVPSQLAYTEPQQVSLPEATLHQGDAPPGYEEAIRMKVVDIDGEQHVQS